jgi:hypothetical protein
VRTWDNLERLAESTYENRLKEAYADEVAAAKAAKITGVSCPGDDFDQLVAEGERLVFVVTIQRELIVAPQIKNGFEIRHPVLAGGQNVLAAGELELVHGGDMKLVLTLTNKSGHYEPEPGCLDVAVQVLEHFGYTVPPDVVRPYPGE